MNESYSTDRPISIATHSGTFHADDVFAVAVLRLLIGDDSRVDVVRTRDSSVIENATYVVDVGGEYDPERQQFDHHQIGGAGERDNGIPYAAFGLVWNAYGEQIAGSSAVAQAIDEKMIQTIDGLDNGVDISNEYDEVNFYLIHNLIFAFRPTWNEERDNENAFHEVLPIAQRVLEREIAHARDRQKGAELAEAAYNHSSDKRIIELEDGYPWLEVFVNKPEPLFVVQPHDDDNGNWKVRAVRESLSTFNNRKDLPEEWAGKRGEELAEVTGVDDAVFCHNKRFIAVAGSREGARKLAQRALEA